MTRFTDITDKGALHEIWKKKKFIWFSCTFSEGFIINEGPAFNKVASKKVQYIYLKENQDLLPLYTQTIINLYIPSPTGCNFSVENKERCNFYKKTKKYAGN